MKLANVVVDFFLGQLLNFLQCTECKTKSISFDPFMDIPLPIPVS